MHRDAIMIPCASALVPVYRRNTSGDAAICALRSVASSDLAGVADFLSHLSTDTLYMRYLTPKLYGDPIAIRREAQRVVASDGCTAVLVAQSTDDGCAIIGVGELVRDSLCSASAELALMIADGYQGQGIGRTMTRWLLAEAAQRGVSSVQVEMLAENRRMRRLVLGLKLPYRSFISEGDMSFILDIKPAQHWMTSSI